MKIKHLILSALAVASIAVSCKKDNEQNSDKPSLTLNPAELSFEVAGGTQTVSVEANRDWSISDPDKIASWLTVEKKSDTEVEVTAAKNDGKDRTAEVTLRIVGVKKSISVSQKGEGGAVEPVEEGDGSKEKPYTVAQATDVAKALAADAYTETAVYVKGTVVSLKDPETTISKYGSITLYISDNGTEDGQFYVYGLKDVNGSKFTAADKFAAGDVVVLYGKLQNFKGNTPEMATGGQLVSVNGKEPEAPVLEEVTATGVVVAVSKAGFLVNTTAGIKYVFDSKVAPTVEVGDNVTVKGSEDTYNGVTEIVNYTVTVNSKNNPVTHPDAVEITSDNIATYSGLFTYVKTSGNLVVSGNYYNITISGATTKASLSFATGVDAALNGKNVVVEGYFVGFSGTGNAYFNILYTNIALSGEQPDPTPDPTPDPEPENPNAVTWTAGSNNSYDAEVKVGEKTYKGFKLGKGSAVGSINVTIPAGVSKVTFYGGAWKGKTAGLKISFGETEVFNKNLTAFDGLTSNSPYTVAGVTDESKYTLDVTALNGGKALDAAVTVKAESVQGTDYRVVVWNVVAE